MRSVRKNASEDKQTKKLVKSQIMDSQTECPICLQDYDLLRVVPMMICYNQHSSCVKCLSDVYKKRKCPICCQKLVSRSDVKKNRLVSFMLEEMYRENNQVLLYANGYTYKGEVKNGKRNGLGQQLTKEGTFLKGHFVDGELTGRCEVITKNGARFTGEAKNGRLQGAFTTKYGSIVQGSFDIETLSGPNCKKIYTNGDEYIGMITRLKANGHGKLKFSNGNTFEGSFTRDYISGEGSATITGTFQMDIRSGEAYLKQIQEQIQINPEQSENNVSQISSEESESSYRGSGYA